ncbi:hypothetical protein KUF71_010121 [Frankliniella fusca]|uniref:Reverse transcriptase domain-containing protein n=1 Tax=Frankliniella fusca TaxID=407009 RepID=A0AAE1LJI5_9NEOP|nr:hypothetical protein KUF71_010121 [Frankliniella fusca]
MAILVILVILEIVVIPNPVYTKIGSGGRLAHGVSEIAGPSAAWRAEPAQAPDRPWQGTSEDMYHTQEEGGQQHDTDWDCLFQFQAVPQGQVQGGPAGPQPQPRRPIKVPVRINGDVVEMEIDTGAGPSPLRLRAWNGTAVPVVGQVMVTAAFGGVTAQVSIHVGRGKGPTLLGRDWFWLLGFRVVHGAVPDWVTELNWAQVPASRPDQLQHRTSPGGAAGAGVVNAQQYLQRFACFKSGLGRYNGPPVHLSVDPECPPIRFRARPVPYARREGVEKEIDRLVQEGTFTPVTASHWQTPLVIVTKQDGSPRLCGDYRLTVNKALQPDPYPVTTVDEAFAQLAGSSCFTKLDLAMAYAQLPVTPETADLLTVTTSKGLFRFHPNQPVWFRTYGPDNKVRWAPGQVQATLGQRDFLVTPAAGMFQDRVQHRAQQHPPDPAAL